ncbi:MAG: hypothetical protein H0U76_01895 [Ktedonobacteraceae bacterium]|nr:hypothetical protein [Ktedonobacteraceae bacterium]
MSNTLIAVGAPVWVKIGSGKKAKTYAGIVLESSDLVANEYGPEFLRVRLQELITTWTGERELKMWTHPQPIPINKLRRRYLD